MRQVIRNLDQVPGISEVIDPARLPSTQGGVGHQCLPGRAGAVPRRHHQPPAGALPGPAPPAAEQQAAHRRGHGPVHRRARPGPAPREHDRPARRAAPLRPVAGHRAPPHRVARPADPRRHGGLHAGRPAVPQDQAPGRAGQPGLPRRHHLCHRGVLPLRRAVRVGRRPGPAADHPRRHAAPHPAGSPVHPRPPARPGDGADPRPGMPAAALRAADRPVERRPPHRDPQAAPRLPRRLPRRHPAAAARPPASPCASAPSPCTRKPPRRSATS